MKASGVNALITGGAIAILGIYAVKIIARSVNWFDPEDKVILITGGSRGLGLVIARKLAAKKANIVICGRNAEIMGSVSKELLSKAGRFLYIQCDISDREQVNRMIDEIEEKMGTVDAVINNAGIMSVGPMETMMQEDYEAAMKVHFWGPFHIINRVLQGMKMKKSGRIVNVVSIGGVLSFPHLLPYNVSKFAFSGYSEGLTAEVSRYNIKVTTIYPGLMATGSPRNITIKGEYEREYAWFSRAASLPVFAINPEKAAERIITAMQGGEKTVTLTIPAKAGKAARGLFPALVITIFGVVNRLLPAYKGRGHEPLKARDIIPRTAVNKRSAKAERDYNQE